MVAMSDNKELENANLEAFSGALDVILERPYLKISVAAQTAELATDHGFAADATDLVRAAGQDVLAKGPIVEMEVSA